MSIDLFVRPEGAALICSAASLLSRLPRRRAGRLLFFPCRELFVPLQPFSEFVTLHKGDEIRLVVAPGALICCVDRPGYRARFVLYRPKDNVMNPFTALKIRLRSNVIRRPAGTQAADSRPGSQLGLF